MTILRVYTLKAIPVESFYWISFYPESYSTPRKINIERENDGLEDDFPFPGMHSQVPC